MASHVVVIGADLRRATVKVNPGTFLIEVLEEACRKLGISSDANTLRHKQKRLDLTVPFRATGLSPGAKLELVVKSNSPTVVSVALKLPPSEAVQVPGGRLIEKLRSDTTLWKTLRLLESKDKKLNFTARAFPGTSTGNGQLLYEAPTLNIMGRELSSVSDLQKTLSQVGINQGSTLLQLSFRKTDQPLHEALQLLEQYFQDIEGGRPQDQAKISTQTPEKDTARLQPHPEETKTDTSFLSSQPELTTEAPAQRQPTESNGSTTLESTNIEVVDLKAKETTKVANPVIYSAPVSSTPAAASVVEADAIYQPTVAHAQLHQERLKASAQNKRLLSDRELEEQAAAHRAKVEAVQSIRVRVRFPDGTAAQWNFGPEATGADLYQGVRSVMRHSQQPFHLGLPIRPGASGVGRRETISDSNVTPRHSLVRGYELEGGVVVNLIWEDTVPISLRKESFLRDQARNQARELPVPEVPKGEEESDEENSKKGKEKSSHLSLSSKHESRDGEGSGGAKKMPKWLKLGKK